MGPVCSLPARPRPPRGGRQTRSRRDVRQREPARGPAAPVRNRRRPVRCLHGWMCLQGRLAQLCIRQAVQPCLTPSTREQRYHRGSPGARADADAPHRPVVGRACPGTAAVSHRHPRPVASRRSLTAVPPSPKATPARGSRVPRATAGRRPVRPLVPAGAAVWCPQAGRGDALETRTRVPPGVLAGCPCYLRYLYACI